MHDSSEAFLCNSFGDEYLYSVNGEDFNESGAEAFYRTRINKEFFREHCLHLVVGTDSGLLPKYLIQQGIPKGTRYIFVEPPQLLGQIAPIFPSHPRLMLSTAEQAFDALNAQTQLGEAFFFYHGQALLHHSAGSMAAYLDDYADIRHQLSEEIRLRTFVHQGRGNQSSHERNRLINAPEPSESAEHLKGLFQGKTAVIMAAGHSLTQEFDWVSANRQNLVVIAISRVCNILYKHGLTPDIIVSIDPFAINFHQSLGIYNFPRSLLAHGAYCNHNLIGLWSGRRVTLSTRFSWHSRYNSDFVDSYNITVSNTAMDMAFWLGCRQILLLGLDLCHNSQGIVYADAQLNPARALQSQLIKVHTNEDRVSFTSQDYLEAARGISEQASQFLRQDTITINPSAQALAMDGVAYRPIETIELEPMDTPALALIHARLPPLDKLAWWAGMEKELQGKIKDLQDMQKQVSQAQGLLKVIQGGNKGQKNPFEKLRKITARLDDDILDIGDAAFVKKLHWADFTRVAVVLENEEEGSAIKAQVLYMDTWAKSLTTSIGYLRLALEKLNLLRREYQAGPEAGINLIDWGRLLNRQPMAGHYGYDGNCFRWAQSYPEKFAAMGETWKGLVGQCAELFAAKVKAGPPRPAAPDTSSMLLAIEKVPELVRQFVRAEDAEALEALAELLGQFPRALSDAMRHYCLGQRAELLQQPAEAIASYQTCLGLEHGPEAKLLLERIGQLSLNQGDFDLALDTLSRLEQVSPSYLKTRAEVLTLLDRPEEAIEAFSQYLQHYPSDMHTMPTLAQLLLGQGELERLLQLALEMERHNPGAPLMQELIALVKKAIAEPKHIGGQS